MLKFIVFLFLLIPNFANSATFASSTVWQLYAKSNCSNLSGYVAPTAQQVCTMGSPTTALIRNPPNPPHCSHPTYATCTQANGVNNFNAYPTSSCPSNSTASGSTCTPNAGFSAINTNPSANGGTGSWIVVSAGSECASPQLYNSANGLCEAPVVPEPEPCKTDTIIESYKVVSNCTSKECEIGDGKASAIQAPTFVCKSLCQYDRVVGSIHRCYALGPTGGGAVVYPTDGYCASDFKGTGQSCTDVTISIDSSLTTEPISSTSPIKNDLNSGVPVGSTAGSGSSSSGGSGSSSGGSGSIPSGSTPPPNNSTPPSASGGYTSENQNASAPCDSSGGPCASEATLQDIRNAITNDTGSAQAPELNDNLYTSSDMSNLLVSNSKIQSLFKWEVPAHNSSCPVLDLSVPFLGFNGTLNAHCIILEPHSATVRFIATISWIFIGVMVILGA